MFNESLFNEMDTNEMGNFFEEEGTTIEQTVDMGPSIIHVGDKMTPDGLRRFIMVNNTEEKTFVMLYEKTTQTI